MCSNAQKTRPWLPLPVKSLANSSEGAHAFGEVPLTSSEGLKDRLSYASMDLLVRTRGGWRALSHETTSNSEMTGWVVSEWAQFLASFLMRIFSVLAAHSGTVRELDYKVRAFLKPRGALFDRATLYRDLGNGIELMM